MNTVFEEHNVDQALNKLGDAIHHPSGGYGAPSWAEAHGKDVVQALEELRERMRARDMDLVHGALPVAIYAARELQKYMGGAPCDISNRDAAEVFYRSLKNLIEQLRPVDRQLAEEKAA